MTTVDGLFCVRLAEAGLWCLMSPFLGCVTCGADCVLLWCGLVCGLGMLVLEPLVICPCAGPGQLLLVPDLLLPCRSYKVICSYLCWAWRLLGEAVLQMEATSSTAGLAAAKQGGTEHTEARCYILSFVDL